MSAYGFNIGRSQYRPLRDCVTPDESPAGNVILRVGTEIAGQPAGAWQQSGYVVLKPEEAQRLAAELLELAGEDPAPAEPELEFELEAIGYGPATLSNDVTDRTGINPGDALTERINATGAALLEEIKRSGYGLDPSELESMRAEAADCFAPSGVAKVAALIGDSPGLLRQATGSTVPSATIENHLEAVFCEIGAAVFDSVAATIKAGTSDEELDPGDPEECEVFSLRADLESGRRDLVAARRRGR